MTPTQEPLDAIIIHCAGHDCPCEIQHDDTLVDMIIYRTIYNTYVKSEIYCDISGKSFIMMPMFVEQS